MRRITILCLALLASVMTMAQIRVPNSRVTFDFPNKSWKFLETKKIDKNTVAYLYSYTGKLFTDNTGEKEPPFMLITVRSNYSKTVYEMAYERYLQQPFQSINEYTDNLPSEEALGYVGAYTSPTDEKDYKFHMIYFKDNTTIFEIRLETELANFETMDKEFSDILNTVKLK